MTKKFVINNGKQDQKEATCVDFAEKSTHKTLCQFEGYNSRSKIIDGNNKLVSYGTANKTQQESEISISDIIGSFGWFQLVILLFSGLREGSVGYDAVVMSIILQPEKNFFCSDSPPTNYIWSNTSIISKSNETAQCFQSINERLLVDYTGKPIRCESWVFPQAETRSVSLVAEWELVCDHHWLVAFIQSAYFFGLVLGNLCWGYTADKIGRRKAYLIAHTLALISGCFSIFAPSVRLFAICRFLSAFGSIGYNIIYSLQMELIGTKHRSFSTTLNHIGWGLGVICVPLADHIFSHYRYIIAIAPMLTLIMFPWAFWIPESSRWLMANEDFPRARQELIRGAKFNGKTISPLLEKKIELFEQKIKMDKMRQESGIGSELRPYSLLFKNRKYAKDTLILSYVSFIGHLFYYLLTINFAYMKNLSTDANFIISGIGDWLSVLIGASLLGLYSRRACITLFSFLLAISFVFQAIIDSETTSTLETPLVVASNNAMGTLSSLLLIFVAMIVSQEVYPTMIRQTGSSIVNTVGESGSTLAPLLLILAHSIGIVEADILYAVICIISMISIQFVTKTDDIELPDT